MDNTESSTSQVPTPAEVAAQTATTSNEATTTEAPGVSTKDSPDTFDREYVEKLRREAAGYRSKLKELEPLAKQFQEQQDANKTELEKAQERIAALEAEKQTAAAQATRARIAADTGVPVQLLPDTADEDTLIEAATALKEWAQSQAPQGAPKVPGVGTAQGGTTRDDLARSILGI